MAKMAKWEFMKGLYKIVWTDAGLSRAIPGSLFWSVSSMLYLGQAITFMATVQAAIGSQRKQRSHVWFVSGQ